MCGWDRYFDAFQVMCLVMRPRERECTENVTKDKPKRYIELSAVFDQLSRQLGTPNK
jgi:hypothetical protein